MSNISKTVTPAKHFVVVGTVNPDSPMDMSVNLDGVDSSKFSEEEFEVLFDQATTMLNTHFDTLLGMDTSGNGIDEPIEDMTVEVDDEYVTITNIGEDDGTLIGNAQMADAVIDASRKRINKRR